MNNTVFVVFSGGCFSGKTTTMLKAKEIFEKHGHTVVMLNELARKQEIKSIDELRKNPTEYMQFEASIIREKIKQEIKLHKQNKKQIVLVDRSITDSLFYLTFYSDKSNFDENQLANYTDLHHDIMNHIGFAFNHIYGPILEFSPITVSENDDTKLRPKQIDLLKYIEHDLIHTLNTSFAKETGRTIKHFDLNADNSNEVITDYFERLAITYKHIYENDTKPGTKNVP